MLLQNAAPKRALKSSIGTGSVLDPSLVEPLQPLAITATERSAPRNAFGTRRIRRGSAFDFMSDSPVRTPALESKSLQRPGQAQTSNRRRGLAVVRPEDRGPDVTLGFCGP